MKGLLEKSATLTSKVEAASQQEEKDKKADTPEKKESTEEIEEVVRKEDSTEEFKDTHYIKIPGTNDLHY